MKTAAKSNRSSIFLMEMILAIFIFAIAGSICMQIFVRSHKMSEDAKLLSAASLEVSTAADTLRSKDSVEEAIKDFVSPLYFDKTFQRCSAKNAAYALVTDSLPSDSPDVLRYHVAVYPCSNVSAGISFECAEPICGTDVTCCIRKEVH